MKDIYRCKYIQTTFHYVETIPHDDSICHIVTLVYWQTTLSPWNFRIEIKPITVLSNRIIRRLKLNATHLKYRHTSACITKVYTNRSHAERPRLGLPEAQACDPSSAPWIYFR